jgi:hypothetical protein
MAWFSAPRGSRAASARAAAAISESIGIPPHLSLSPFRFPALNPSRDQQGVTTRFVQNRTLSGTDTGQKALLSTQLGDCVFPLCPPLVHNINGTKSYVCRSRLLVELAANSNKASSTAILAILEREGLLNASAHTPDEAQTMEALSSSTFMPEWATAVAEEAIASMDFDTMVAELAQSRMGQLQSLLGSAKR